MTQARSTSTELMFKSSSSGNREGADVASWGHSFRGVFGRAESQTRIVRNGDDQASGDCLQLRLLSSAAVVGGRRVTADGHASALSVFGPVEVIGTPSSCFFVPVIDHDPVGFDPILDAED
jgi:hypothetical protein